MARRNMLESRRLPHGWTLKISVIQTEVSLPIFFWAWAVQYLTEEPHTSIPSSSYDRVSTSDAWRVQKASATGSKSNPQNPRFLLPRPSPGMWWRLWQGMTPACEFLLNIVNPRFLLRRRNCQGLGAVWDLILGWSVPPGLCRILSQVFDVMQWVLEDPVRSGRQLAGRWGRCCCHWCTCGCSDGVSVGMTRRIVYSSCLKRKIRWPA